MTAPVVVGYDEQELEPVDLDRWVQLAQAVLRHEGVMHGELTLLFVDEAAIAALHQQHMDEAGPTDVLSFPLDADMCGTDHAADDDDVPLLLGDVVVCPSVARTNAPAHAGTYEDELALLVVHGVLHVLGHDHAEPDDASAMRAREHALLERFHRS
jgi:probable rRNA maturation factor